MATLSRKKFGKSLAKLTVIFSLAMGMGLIATAPNRWLLAQDDAPVVSSVPVPESDETMQPETVKTVTPPSPPSPFILDLVESIAEARKKLDVASLPKPVESRKKLDSAISVLRERMGRAGTKLQDDWMRFYRMSQLTAELDKAEPDLDFLQQLEKNTRQNYPGLEFPEAISFRSALIEHTNALRFGANPTAAVQALDLRLEALQKVLLERGGSMTDLELDRDLGLIAGFLKSSNQLTELQQKISNRYSRPSASVMVSSSFIQRAFSRPVDQSRPVNEEILGTQLCGTSFISGCVTPQLIPNASAATVRLNMLASFHANNNGFNRRVKVRTSSQAGLSVCETVQLTPHGLFSMDDTRVDANFQSTILSIDHPLKIVRRFAVRKAAEQKPKADAIGQSRLESRLRSQFHEQIEEQLAESNSRITPSSMPILTRIGLKRPNRSSSTTADFLSLLWDTRDTDQLATAADCPLPVQYSGITAQIHQSLVINYLDKLLAGRVIRSQDLDDYAVQFGAKVSSELEAEATGEPWSVTLASYHPVEVEFDGNQVAFQIRTVRLDRGDQSLNQPATIRANYRVEVIDGFVQLYRVGDVDIQFTGRDRRGVRGTTMRAFLKSKFDKVFRSPLFESPVRPTDRLPAEAPSLRIISVETGAGWLQAFLD